MLKICKGAINEKEKNPEQCEVAVAKAEASVAISIKGEWKLKKERAKYEDNLNRLKIIIIS